MPAAVQLRAVVPPGAANRPDPTPSYDFDISPYIDAHAERQAGPVLYNGRYTGSELPERVKAPLPPGASVIDDTIADWLRREGIAP